MIAFGVCIALAIDWKKQPEFHRRLMFIATVGLMDAPIAHLAFLFDHNLFYLGLDAMIAIGVVRDLTVDRRGHKVHLYARPC